MASNGFEARSESKANASSRDRARIIGPSDLKEFAEL